MALKTLANLGATVPTQFWDNAPDLRPVTIDGERNTVESTSVPERNYRQPVWATDADGSAIVRVELASNRGVAVISAEDFERLRQDGMSDQWNLSASGGGKGRVYTNWQYGNGRSPSVARAILGADLDEIVRYRDGDPTNLRRDNLYCQTVRRRWAEDPEYLATPGRIATGGHGDGSAALNRLKDRYGELPYEVGEDGHGTDLFYCLRHP